MSYIYPITIFERIAVLSSINRYWLYPVPVILIFVLVSVIPNIVVNLSSEVTELDGFLLREGPNTNNWELAHRTSYMENFTLKSTEIFPGIYISDSTSIEGWNDVFKPSHRYLIFNISWLAITIFVLYGYLFYKKQFFTATTSLKDNGIITDQDIQKIVQFFTDRRIFLMFLVMFELTFFIWWHGHLDYRGNYYLIPTLDVTSIVMYVLILPIGAEIFSCFFAGSFFPRLLRDKIQVDVYNSDVHGGLKPISDIMITISIVYFTGIFYSWLVYPPFASHPFFGGLLLFLGVLMFLVPQLSSHTLMIRTKTLKLNEIQSKITFVSKKINEIPSDDVLEHKEKLSSLSSSLDAYTKARAEIERMKTWPFDVNTIYKFLTAAPLPILPIIIQLSGLCSASEGASMIATLFMGLCNTE